ncbi:rhodanese-like domain-containing protein [Erythrobacter sp. SCSIO 43205]|uniref:rhodanese-like domain-containing protein n=1 Tax=Erythrobacter sp. SCSIO 43205 TaxID=2779361 RepID=UPI001CA9A7D4|nr:rhodanese-like domain-containing protein [Erythrobacter sp. SCSIO 43205]UAB78792.1 rhodanese-like domain-containing protein [Erythrobacter sp. SCSIO 43205]
MKRVTANVSLLSAVFVVALAACSPQGSDSTQAQEPNLEAMPAQSSGLRDVSVSEAKALLEGESAPQVIDVRTPEEFAAGHIEGATNINFMSGDFAAEIAKLDKSQPYLLHCKSGNRSAKALAEMESQGFENIAHMTGGYDAWEAESAESSAK